MSFLQALFPWAFRNGAAVRKPRAYIIDAAPLCTAGRSDSGITPGDQINGLRRLSRFVSREKIEATVIFDSEPLRKVGQGEKFDGITVHFTGKSVSLADLSARLIRQAGGRKEVVFITADRKLEEQVADHGALVMRMSTFRKSLDGGGSRSEEEPRRERGGNPRRRPQGSRDRDRDRDPNRERGRSRERDGERGDNRPRAEKASAGGTVHDLIDVVD